MVKEAGHATKSFAKQPSRRFLQMQFDLRAQVLLGRERGG